MTLADLLVPGSGRTRLHFPSENTTLDYGDMWRSGEALGCLAGASGGAPVAIALTNTSECAATVIGAIAAGQPLVSVPMPPRGADLEWYSQFIRRICAISGASTLLMDSALRAMVPPMEGLTLLSFAEVLAMKGPGVVDPGSFVLTQFTSGSTADPKGVVLSGDKIVANLRVLMDWLEVVPGDGVCSWLPLSHDMGLIGTFLGALAGAGDAHAHGLDLVLMTPQEFLRSPGRWLAACEEFSSTITVAPNYGYEMAARRRNSGYDLRRLRTCIAGGEPIRPDSLERFAAAFADSGFDPTALCPSYGMAEAVLAVTGTRTAAHWRATAIETLVEDPRAELGVAPGQQVVSSGPALPGYEVRIDDTSGQESSGLGEILVRGPSLAESYADGSVLADADGWFRTRDLGVSRDGELYVFGRIDDVFQVAGRNIYALDVEAHAGEVDGVRAGRVVAVSENGALTLVAECEPDFAEQSAARGLAKALHQQVAARVGVAPRRVLLAPRGALPLTSSGKIRRKPLVAALQSAQLTILAGSLE